MSQTTLIASHATLDTAHVARAAARWIARRAPGASRVALGLVFFVFGLNGFLDFLPHPTAPVPERAMAFGGAMMSTGYLFQLVKGTEVLVGLLLLVNRFVPLALALIAPVIVNIFAFHAFLAPSGLALAIVLVALELHLAWSYRKVYRPMLSARAGNDVDRRRQAR